MGYVNAAAMKQTIRTLALTALLAGVAIPGARAQDAPVPGQIKILLDAAGGTYDLYARLVSRHWGDKLPGNPKILVEYMPGNSGTRALNYLYLQAPRDGTVVETVNSAMAFYQRTGQPGIQYDANKLNWIGSLTRAYDGVTIYDRGKVKTIEDAMNTEVIVGASGAAGTMAAYPAFMNNVLGTKFKIVMGYQGGGDVLVAMERGEVDGPGNRPWSTWRVIRPEWYQDKKIVPLVQLSLKKAPDLPDVPLLIDLARNEEEREMFYFLSSHTPMEQPFVGPPDMDSGLLATYRKAFTAMYNDPDFIADAKKSRMELEPHSGEEVQEIVKGTLATPQHIVDRVKAALTVTGADEKK
jgi:tripartite-type tricarboxylate transporter receptor subunit TctC